MRILLTAGPTREPLDAVRYLSNRSSGRLGLALAGAAHRAGHDLTLLLGPVSIEKGGLEKGMRVFRFETTAQLQGLLAEHFPACQVLIMAAAVADYRPVRRTGQAKLPRGEGSLTVELQATDDLVAGCAAVRRPDQCIIGFALEEPDRLAERAQQKLQCKGLDAIVANPLATMGAEDIQATIFHRDGRVLRPGPMSKQRFAAWFIEHLAELCRGPARR